MSSTALSRWVVALSVLLLAVGCSSTSTPAPEPTPPGPLAKSNDSRDANDVTVGSVASAHLEPVYFDTDRAALRPDTRRALKGYAESILEHPEWGVVSIDGHCDERGSDAYNYALGRRRADAVLQFLVEQGVPASRLETRSFGAEQPAVAGHDENAWRFNRRSEVRVEALQTALR